MTADSTNRTNPSPDQTQTEVERLRAQVADLERIVRQQQDEIDDLNGQLDAYNTLAHHFPNGIVALFDRDLRYTVFDGQGVSEGGPQPEDMIGKRLRDVFPPDVYERDEPLLRATLAGDETYSEVQYGDRYHEVRTAPVFDANGDITGGLVMTQEITARKRAEIALRERERFIQRVADTVPGLLYVYDVIDERNTYVNRELTRMLGYSAEQVQRMGDQFLISTIHPDDWPRVVVANGRAAALHDGEVTELEYRIRRGDGSWCHLYSWETPFEREPDGTLRSRLGIALDMTERKAAEAELVRYRERLEDLVEQRTAALRAANQHLRVLGRAKDEFVTNVSHELRTPITNLVLRQHVLANRPDEVTQHLPVIRRETARLKHLVENLLILSRLDQDRQQWRPVALDLNRLVRQYVDDRRALAEQQGIQLALQLDAVLPPAHADPDLIEQVLGILLTNALSYTPAGGTVQVRTGTRLVVARGEELVGFSVIDDGPGLAPDDQPHVFERFFRGDAGKQSGLPGTGLGLAIAHEIVTRHNGLIDARNVTEPGTGAEFRVLLPLHGDPHG